MDTSESGTEAPEKDPGPGRRPRLADVLHGTAGSAFGPRTAVAGGGILVIDAILTLTATMPALRRYRV